MDTQQVNSRDRLIELRRELETIKSQAGKLVSPSAGLMGVVINRLDKLLGGREQRILFLREFFQQPTLQSSKELEPWQRFALVRWAAPAQLVPDSPWTFDPHMKTDCFLIKTTTELRNHEQEKPQQETKST